MLAQNNRKCHLTDKCVSSALARTLISDGDPSSYIILKPWVPIVFSLGIRLIFLWWICTWCDYIFWVNLARSNLTFLEPITIQPLLASIVLCWSKGSEVSNAMGIFMILILNIWISKGKKHVVEHNFPNEEKTICWITFSRHICPFSGEADGGSIQSKFILIVLFVLTAVKG